MTIKKSRVTQELVNTFPQWTSVRNDPQSVGYRFLNILANRLEDLEKELIRAKANQTISTSNLDEIDLTYRVKLPTTFSFSQDTSDPTNPISLPPLVSGLIEDTWYLVSDTPDSEVKTFWYNTPPDRISFDTVISGVDTTLLEFVASDSPQSGVWRHHIPEGGSIWIETIGGIQYLDFSDNQINRGQVKLEGYTRKGTYETETVIFPWDQKQRSSKEFKELTKVSAFNIEDNVAISIRSADFNSTDYIDPWNISYSPNRKKIDQFWGLGLSEGIPTLDRIEFITDEWEQLVLGFSDKHTVESWELLNSTNNITSGINLTVSGVDIAIQPYSDRLFVATTSSIYLYDLSPIMVSGLSFLRDSTPGADINFDIETPYVVLGQELLFTPWHAKPVKEIINYEVFFETPSGQRYGLLDGSPVSYSSDFAVKVEADSPLTRTVNDLIAITASERGEYKISFYVTFIDGTTQEYRRIIPVNYKTPVAVFELSSIVPEEIVGIDFDSDQKLWVKTVNNNCYRLNLHTDVMLIDYQEKTIYFKEDYDEVDIIVE